MNKRNFSPPKKLHIKKTNVKKFNNFLNKVQLAHSNLLVCLSHLNNTGENRSLEHKLRIIRRYIKRIELKLNKSPNTNNPSIIHEILKTLHVIKISFDVCLKFKQNKKMSDRNFVTKSYLILQGSDFKKFFNKIIDYFLNFTKKFQGSGSNFNFVGIVYVSAMLMKCNNRSGSGYIPLPRKISKRRACVNINNGKNAKDYFLWAVNSALLPARGHTALKYSYSHWRQQLKIGKIPLPMKVLNIPKFEQLNNLLLFYDQEKFHYCWIKNVSALLHCTT